ncbi:MAG TPA: hypothetical protein VGO83_02190 [Thermoleophilaceae bacterium]|nr:hypothetical protein [Thermoleophilaceae bacterium]
MAPVPPVTGSPPPEAAGPAHVAVVSFLAARAAPTGGFWVALAGGVALARLAERRGARVGFGASAAAMLETVAIIGPARFGVPLTQALSAPMLGRLHARGVGFWPSFLACAAVRLVHNAATTAFFIWVIAGGLDAYAGTYDAIGRRVGLEVGTADALALTVLTLLAWAAFASTVQVLVYRRGLRSWPTSDRTEEQPPSPRQPSSPRWMTNVADSATFVIQLGRFDPRAVALAASLAFVLLLAGTEWSLLGAVAGWLLVVWLLARGDREPLAAGAVFAGVLALGAFAFALGGGLGLELALRRATRAALLVLAATWLRSAAGVGGLREVFHRVLDRLRRVPAAPEAAAVLDAIASERRLAESARSLAQLVGDAPKRPRELLDAVLAWVRREAGAYRAAPPAPSLRLHARAADLALVASALAPALALTLA